MPVGCEGLDRITADFDGDHRADAACQFWHGTSHFVRVVTAAGPSSDAVDVGNGEAFGEFDIEPDGRAELVAGGTSANAAYEQLLVWVDGGLRLVRVESEQGEPLVLVHDVLGTAAWGCKDVNSDGAREIVRATVEFEPSPGTWMIETFRLDAAVAETVNVDKGSPAPAFDRERPGTGGAEALVSDSPCDRE